MSGEDAKAMKIRVDNVADEFIVMTTQVKRLEDQMAQVLEFKDEQRKINQSSKFLSYLNYRWHRNRANNLRKEQVRISLQKLRKRLPFLAKRNRKQNRRPVKVENGRKGFQKRVQRVH